MSKLFAKPLGALLKLVFDLVSKIGTEPEHISFYAIAIIITTIIFKFILLPIGLKQTKSMSKMQKIQPELKELQDKYKDDPQTLQAKTMKIYKENNVNPFSGCLILIIQLPIILGFFKALRDPITYVFKDPKMYEALNKVFLWIPNLEKPDPYMWGLPLLAGLTTFLQSRLMSSQAAPNDQAASTQKTMNIILPLMIWWSARAFPAGLALYWTISNTFQIVQQIITNRSLGEIKEESN
ncbi:YidC/Oxa1 family membrane protein insertase [Anaerosalibacter bizertensis]|uniref:YidC/Oxa1 family membrane protein insertase n=1 Tax=Anaerosalibacter bizertensis TaxID=932217 RepID=A0A844FJH8_9FIRM|nr:YidC/Oxa1 family membrane protein insertase [Anaerosalibacter bizertensis]MBV1817268.1 YidC/Oxa1 family membrane protein insertase [Bacteroidales bacterium MSK.15.36]HHV25602.1 YidC/Oxa1 family membrane protein insertase [Tissierellia bacterium]MBU5294707.1 YidC/Oxa1 family membrane protein insertase [Anaerosalibacter bizertensis]MCB5560147.1 YidC/Oxa1 family membrane protein insertase [Anaerosalibacter bizertensis]MCG4565343.1 YidC/Oxa1 family membrane protein insertase [Anaerosalibacter b